MGPTAPSAPMRRLVIGVVLTAAVATACSGGAGADTTPPTTVAGPTTTAAVPTEPTEPPAPSTSAPEATGAEADDYLWQAGDCFDFGLSESLESLPYAPYGDGRLVSCDASHTHEVFLVDRHPEGPEAVFPGDDLGDRVEQACAAGFRNAIGVFESESVFETVLYLPDADEWAAGERYLACVLYRPGIGGIVQSLTESALGLDERARWEAAPGDCLLRPSGTPRDGNPVACSGEHVLEVVGEFVHPAAADEPYPGSSTLTELADAECRAEFLAEGGAEAPHVIVAAQRLGEAEWLAGARRMLCLALVLSDVGELVETRGSLFGEWEITGRYTDDDVITA